MAEDIMAELLTQGGEPFCTEVRPKSIIALTNSGEETAGPHFMAMFIAKRKSREDPLMKVAAR